MPSMPHGLHIKTPDPWCKVCGGRHHYEQCSVHAPEPPPKYYAPAPETHPEKFGPIVELPSPPGNVEVFRGRFKFPLASFNWRRFVHGLDWKYSNTDLPIFHRPRRSFSVSAIMDRALLDIFDEDERVQEEWDELLRDRDYTEALDVARQAKHEVLEELRARYAYKTY